MIVTVFYIGLILFAFIMLVVSFAILSAASDADDYTESLFCETGCDKVCCKDCNVNRND